MNFTRVRSQNTITYIEDQLYCFSRKRHSSRFCLLAGALNRSSRPLKVDNCVDFGGDCFCLASVLNSSSAPVEIYTIIDFQGGDCFCLGHLLGGRTVTNSAYAKNNRVDLLYRLAFCGKIMNSISRTEYKTVLLRILKFCSTRNF